MNDEDSCWKLGLRDGDQIYLLQGNKQLVSQFWWRKKKIGTEFQWWVNNEKIYAVPFICKKACYFTGFSWTVSATPMTVLFSLYVGGSAVYEKVTIDLTTVEPIDVGVEAKCFIVELTAFGLKPEQLK